MCEYEIKFCLRAWFPAPIIKIIWEYGREIRLDVSDHILASSVDLNGNIIPYNENTIGVHGTLIFAHNGMHCNIIRNTKKAEDWTSLFHEHIIWNRYIRDCGGTDRENNSKIAVASKLALAEQSTIFASKWRDVLMVPVHYYRINIRYIRELNIIFDELHKLWMADMTSHW